jgi:hypothetical protein
MCGQIQPVVEPVPFFSTLQWSLVKLTRVYPSVANDGVYIQGRGSNKRLQQPIEANHGSLPSS